MNSVIFRGAAAHLLIGAFLISFSPVFARLAGSATTASGFYRMVFGLVGLTIMLVFGGRVQRSGFKGFLVVSLSGLFFSLDIYFWHLSIFYVGPGLATLLANFQVFFLAALDVFVFRQKLNLKLIIAVMLAFCGLYLLAGVGWGARDASFRLGVGYGLMTAMMYTGYIYTLRLSGSLKKPVDKRVSMFILTGVAGILLGITAIASGESLAIPDIRTGVYLLAYGLLCQALAWVIIASALPKTKLTVSGLILLLQPALAYVWDVTIFSKAITPIELAGASIALVAIYIGTVRNVH